MRPDRLRLAPLALLFVACLSAPASAATIAPGTITWNWATSVYLGGSSVQYEKGTFTTNNAVGATGTSSPAGLYKISDMSITSDVLGLKLGSAGGSGHGIVQEFRWNGSSPTDFMTSAFGFTGQHDVGFSFPNGQLVFSTQNGYPGVVYSGSPSVNSGLQLTVASVVNGSTTVPEPSTLLMGLVLALGGAGRLALRRRAGASAG